MTHIHFVRTKGQANPAFVIGFVFFAHFISLGRAPRHINNRKTDPNQTHTEPERNERNGNGKERKGESCLGQRGRGHKVLPLPYLLVEGGFLSSKAGTTSASGTTKTATTTAAAATARGTTAPSAATTWGTTETAATATASGLLFVSIVEADITSVDFDLLALVDSLLGRFLVCEFAVTEPK